MCDHNWTMSNERAFMETLVCSRFRFFLIFFSSVIGGAIAVEDPLQRTLVLTVGTLISIPFAATIARAQKKLNIALRILFEVEGHPAKILDAACTGRSRRNLIGYGIPLLSCVILVAWATVAWCNYLGTLARRNLMSEATFPWAIGNVVVSIVLGGILSLLWYCLLSWICGVEREGTTGIRDFLKKRGVITGIVERAFFTVAIGAGLSGVTIAMVAWTALKQKTLWALFSGEYKDTNASSENKPDWDRVGVSLLASLGSMVIAIVAGKICSGDLLQSPIEDLRSFIFRQ